MARGWLAGAVILAALALAAPLAAARDALGPGESLTLKDRLVPAGRGLGGTRLAFDKTGDLVLYFGGTIDRWRAGVGGKGAAQATLRPDGEFVVTDKAGKVLWSSGAKGFPNPKVGINDFGELEIFSDGRPVWEAGRGRIEENITGAGAPHKRVGDHLAPGGKLRPGEMLVMQEGVWAYLKFSPNGRLGLYSPGGAMRVWLANTRPATLLEMRRDGDLVLTDKDGNTVWRSGTTAYPGSSMRFDPEAVMIVPPGRKPVWSTERGFLQENITGFGAPFRNRGNRLNAGDVLRRGEMIANPHGYPQSVRFAENGDFALLNAALGASWRPPRRPGKAAALVMDRQGDLTLKTAEGYVLWRVSGGPGAYAYVDALRFSVFRADDTVAWSSDAGASLKGDRLVSGQEIWGPWRLTAGKQTPPGVWRENAGFFQQGPFGVRLELKADGALELRQDMENKLLYASGTQGKAPIRTTFQAGELALFDKNDRKIFSLSPPSYPGAELQLGGEDRNAGARIARSDGKTVWVKGNPFPDRRYRVEWNDVYIAAYDDGGDGTPALYGSVTVTPFGGAWRAKGHSNIFWQRSNAKGARVRLDAKESYAKKHPGEFADKHQEFVVGPGPKGDYADADSQGVKISIDLKDYDKWSADDPIGNSENTYYFKDFFLKNSWEDKSPKTINLTGEGVSADFKFRLIRLK